MTGVILYKLRSFSQVRIKNTCSPSAILVLFKNLQGLGKKLKYLARLAILMFYHVTDL